MPEQNSRAQLIELSFEVSELERVYERRVTLRKALLLFISKNKAFLQEGLFKDKAEKGYLKDLKDHNIVEACREIFQEAPSSEAIWFPPRVRKMGP